MHEQDRFSPKKRTDAGRIQCVHRCCGNVHQDTVSSVLFLMMWS